MSIFSELKRRNVFKVAAAYVIVGWLVMQAGDVMAPAMHLPDWINSALAFFLVLGFPVALILSWAFELTPDGIKLEKNVDRSESVSRFTGRKLDFIIIALLLIALGFFAFDKFVYQPDHDAGIAESAIQDADNMDAPLATASGSLSIAVLPFVNMSDDEDNEYFSDGISEELLNVLARFPDLRVAARTSAFQFKGENRDIAEIAELLRVGHVLEGSVRKAGKRIRITAQLIEADSGFHLWSESYDRELEDIFAIQDEISEAIAQALRIELSLGDAANPGELPTVPAASSTQAYEYYLKGRQLTNGRGRAGLTEAVVVLERALELDEQYAPAHAQLAIAIALLGKGPGSYGELEMAEVFARANPHIERAFELEPNLAEAFAAKTVVAITNFQYEVAIENSARAMALNPSYMDVINWRYLGLINTGRWTEAMELMDHMMTVDPLSIIGGVNYSYALARRELFDDARRVADDLDRRSAWAGYISHALISGDYLGAIAESCRWYLRALALNPNDAFGRHRLAINLSVVGLHDEARSISPRSRWLINAYQQRWPEAMELAQQDLAADPGSNVSKLNLANVLHMSGDIAGAQSIYEQLSQANPGFPILDSTNSSTMPTARMAYGAMALGDEDRAGEVLKLLRFDQRERQAVGIRESYWLRGAVLASAIEGNVDALVENLEAAIDTGLRDHFILREPALKGFTDHPGFLAQAARLEALIEEERHKTLQLICFENPASEVWEPLPETCADVEMAATD